MLTVLWATARHHAIDWEVSWISELLGDTLFVIRDVTRMDQIVPNALIVVNHNIPYAAYLAQYEALGFPFGLVHLSDEYMTDDVSPYDFACCKFVFRNCYRATLENHPKVTQFALGYKYGFWNDASARIMRECGGECRPLAWSFAGGMRDNRRTCIECFKEIEPHKLVIETGNSFNAPLTGLPTDAYCELMLLSKLVLSPTGNVSVDCFRLYEALECGCVPIALPNTKFQPYEPSYWHKLFGEEPPFVCERTWELNLARVQKLLAEPEEYERVRVKCADFWVRYKRITSARLQEAIAKGLV